MKTGPEAMILFFMFNSNEHDDKYDAHKCQNTTFVSMINITSESLKAIKDLFLTI